eukprot:scaffold625_cov420-Prasinococcus_capsulatus_cf.AAC.34
MKALTTSAFPNADAYVSKAVGLLNKIDWYFRSSIEIAEDVVNAAARNTTTFIGHFDCNVLRPLRNHHTDRGRQSCIILHWCIPYFSRNGIACKDAIAPHLILFCHCTQRVLYKLKEHLQRSPCETLA